MFDIHFSPRSGTSPEVRVYPTWQAEVDGVAAEVRRLVREQRVIASDILVLYRSHFPYMDTLPQRLQEALGPGCQVRLVDGDHEANKRLPLIEDGVLTASTVASAKGYDPPVVFLLGVETLRSDNNNDRALFYVGATRAKLHLVVTGIRQGAGTLLSEAELAVRLPSTSRKAAVG